MSIKDIRFPLRIDSEEEVRTSLAFYFKDLGFSLEDMSFEDSFQIRLGHTTIPVEKDIKRTSIVGGRSDLLLMHMGKPLAIVETKAIENELTDDDRDQGLSYARLLRQMPPYTIVTNGRNLQVFDTFTTEEITSGTPADSVWWKNGQKYVGSDRLSKEWACKTLLNHNFGLFKIFSNQQMELGLRDLKGNINERRRYSPDLYIPRSKVKAMWQQFLESDSLCFSIYGESGTGKTNELCYLSEFVGSQDELLGLFYRGVELVDGLAATIRNDFIWEFERDEPLPRIIKRISEMADANPVKLIIFIDGLDEFPVKPETLRAELIGLCNHLDSNRVRLCLSCKTHDWKSFVYDRGEILNRLGKSTFPPVKETGLLPGLELGLFTESELDSAWDIYRANYHIDGQLQGETRDICRMPLILRLVSETYEGADQAIPPTLTNIVAFDNLWNRKLGEFDQQTKLIMEIIVTKAAEVSTWLDLVDLDEEMFFHDLEPQFSTHPAYADVFRFGLLTRRKVGGKQVITFPFDRMRSYAYINGRYWKEIVSSERVIFETRKVIETRLGRDTFLFYLQTSDRVEKWITLLIEEDAVLFIKAIRLVENIVEKSISHKTDDSKISLSTLVRTIVCYSRLRSLFPSLKSRLSPYSDGEAGILVDDPWHYYRTLTKEYPQLVVLLEGTRTLTVKQRQELQPVDWEPSNMLWSRLRRNIPETVALKEIISKLASLVSTHFLDESTSPDILTERIIDILKYEPSIGFDNSPEGRFWQLLNFSNFDQAVNSSCRELIYRANQLSNEWLLAIKDHARLSRWYRINVVKLVALVWNLEQLIKYSDVIPDMHLQMDEIFGYLEGKGLDITANIAYQLATHVINNYRKMIEKNFSKFLSEFTSYQFNSFRLLLELSEDSDVGIKSDYLHLAYIWLPSLPPGPIIMRIVPLEESLAEKAIIGKKSAENIYSRNVELSTIIDGELVSENNAVISRVRYPDRNPIISQVYQLILNEAEDVFGDQWSWMSASHSSSYDYYEMISRFVLPTLKLQ